jgi:hypothetical protein
MLRCSPGIPWRSSPSSTSIFESGIARGAAIAIGIAAIAVVNDLLAAPDSHPQRLRD